MICEYAEFKGLNPTTQLDIISYSNYAYKAEKALKKAIGDTIVVTNDVKHCFIEIVAFLADNEPQSNSIGVTSERVGDYSVTYTTRSQRDSEIKKGIRTIIKFWLGSQYRGVSCNVK